MSLELLIKKYKEKPSFQLRSKIKHHSNKILAGTTLGVLVTSVLLDSKYEGFYDIDHEKTLIKAAMFLPTVIAALHKKTSEKINATVYALGTTITLLPLIPPQNAALCGLTSYACFEVWKEVFSEYQNPPLLNYLRLEKKKEKVSKYKVINTIRNFFVKDKSELLEPEVYRAEVLIQSKKLNEKQIAMENLFLFKQSSPMKSILHLVASLSLRDIEKMESRIKLKDYSVLNEFSDASPQERLFKTVVQDSFLKKVEKNPNLYSLHGLMLSGITRDGINKRFRDNFRDLLPNETLRQVFELMWDNYSQAVLMKMAPKGKLASEYRNTLFLFERFNCVAEPLFYERGDKLALRYVTGKHLNEVTDRGVLDQGIRDYRSLCDAVNIGEKRDYMLDMERALAPNFRDLLISKCWLKAMNNLGEDYALNFDPWYRNIRGTDVLNYLDLEKPDHIQTSLQLPKIMVSNPYYLKHCDEVLDLFYNGKEELEFYFHALAPVALYLSTIGKLPFKFKLDLLEHALHKTADSEMKPYLHRAIKLIS